MALVRQAGGTPLKIRNRPDRIEPQSPTEFSNGVLSKRLAGIKVDRIEERWFASRWEMLPGRISGSAAM